MKGNFKLQIANRRLKERTAVVTLAAVVICGPLFPQDIPSETWMSIYIGSSKIGYSQSFIKKTTLPGQARLSD